MTRQFDQHRYNPARASGLVIGCALVLLCGCTNQQIYNAAQDNRALECQKYPDTRYEECMASVEKDFEAYSQERAAAGNIK